MGSVQMEHKSYEMPPRGMSIAHFLTVADIEQSARYYEKVYRRSHGDDPQIRPGALLHPGS